jgi:uroporphyrinogen-III synthase
MASQAVSALVGKRIVITRAPHQTLEMERMLRAKGAVPLPYPCIDIAPPHDTLPFDAALKILADGRYDWLVFTSGNTVCSVAYRLNALGLRLPPRNLLERYTSASGRTLHIAAVGMATAEAVKQHFGVTVDLVPAVFSADGLGAMLNAQSLIGARILLPQSEEADDGLHDMLVESGAHVTTVYAYRTVIGSGGINLPALLAAGEVDAITYTSASTVRNLMRRLRQDNADLQLLTGIVHVCIGESTAAAARQQGLALAALPYEHTLEGLIAALEHHFEHR